MKTSILVVYSIYSTENPTFSYSLVPQYKINVTCTDEYSLTSWGEFTVNIKPNKPPELDKLPGTRHKLNHHFFLCSKRLISGYEIFKAKILHILKFYNIIKYLIFFNFNIFCMYYTNLQLFPSGFEKCWKYNVKMSCFLIGVPWLTYRCWAEINRHCSN